MVRLDQSESEPEESENRSSESSERNDTGKKRQHISEYEKQRLSRIAENQARMEAIGLSKMASSLMGSLKNSSKRIGKGKVVEDDEEYRPNDDDCDSGGDDDNGYDEEEKFWGNKGSRSAKRKGKNKRSKSKKNDPVQKQLSGSDYVAADELMQAIALSLQHSAEVSGPTFNERKGKALILEDSGRGKRKKSFTSRVQMTEDEVILHFFQFDEVGKGSINMRDLRRVAVAHDFVWTDEELADMIRCFDNDGDGKLNLEDFQKIASRCNMIRASDHF